MQKENFPKYQNAVSSQDSGRELISRDTIFAALSAYNAALDKKVENFKLDLRSNPELNLETQICLLMKQKLLERIDKDVELQNHFMSKISDVT